MLKLRRLRVEKFRNLARGAELSFSDGINIVLGQNGTGKTTLLELISMVVRSDFSGAAKEEFAIEYELSTADGESIIVVVHNERADVEQLPMSLELGTREVFRPFIELLGGPDRRRLVRHDAELGLSVGDAPPRDPGRPVLYPGSVVFLLAHIVAPSRQAMRDLLAGRIAYRFDESLNLFGRITGSGDLMGDVLLNGQKRLMPNPFAWPLLPNVLLFRMEVVYESHKPDYSFTHEDLDFLATLKGLMGFASCDVRVDATERRRGVSVVSIDLSNFVFRFRWDDGTFVTHERLSYGQKRLLTFFYYVACNSDIVIADELVNGLHHRWISACIEALGERQAFLTSQNPLLLDYVPITSAEQAKRSFVLCRSEPREGGRPAWVWENMSDADAEELFRAYEIGVEHVSEILQSRGLW
jgi:energy-coupling factor transporter ATP-binding protein EcfA2